MRKHGLIDGLDGNACRLLSNRFPMLVGSFLAFSMMMDVCNFFLKRIFWIYSSDKGKILLELNEATQN